MADEGPAGTVNGGGNNNEGEQHSDDNAQQLDQQPRDGVATRGPHRGPQSRGVRAGLDHDGALPALDVRLSAIFIFPHVLVVALFFFVLSQKATFYKTHIKFI